jgi:hypothetical protein
VNNKKTCVDLLEREYPQYAGLIAELLAAKGFRLSSSGATDRERALATFRRHVGDEAVVQEIARRLYAKGVRIFPNGYRMNIGGDYKYSDSLTAKPRIMKQSALNDTHRAPEDSTVVADPVASKSARRAVELFAMERAKKHYSELGCDVVDVSDGEAYDLLCRKAGQSIRVEVKGTQGPAATILLLASEVASAREARSALFIVHSIVLEEKGGDFVARHGTTRILDPWEIESDGKLVPQSYSYILK